MKKICKNCEQWEPYFEMLENCGCCKHTEMQPDNEMLFFSAYGNHEFLTFENFGCILWEEKL